MKEELKGPKVEDISVAMVKELAEDGGEVYNVYLINQKDEMLEQVLVTSRGYVKKAESKEEIKTNMLRRLLGNVEARSFSLIEPVMEDVLSLNNEYWLSFWIGDTMYDKKYVFLAESVIDENLTIVPILEKPGVLIG